MTLKQNSCQHRQMQQQLTSNITDDYDYYYYLRFQHFQRATNVQDGFDAGRHDNNGCAGQFGQVGGNVPGGVLFDVPVDPANAPRDKGSNTRPVRQAHGGGHCKKHHTPQQEKTPRLCGRTRCTDNREKQKTHATSKEGNNRGEYTNVRY
jgi:hypothetical protein